MSIRALLLLLLTVPAFADDGGHPLTLWEVTGQKNSVFLLGSIHLLRPQDYPLPSAIDNAYAAAEVLIMEVDMDDVDPVATQASFARYGLSHDGTTLRDLMGEALYDEAAKAAEFISIPLDMLSKTEPWYAAMTVEIMMLNRMGFNPALGVEMHMLSKATQDGKRIDGLETIEEQLKFLDGMSLQAQRDMLIATLHESAELENVMDDLIEAWRYGDTEALADGMLEDLEQHEELNKAIVTDRNARWVKHIEELLDDDDDYLVIVGALHLVGPEGVPLQLERNGHSIRQLSEPPAVR
ncbi:MAG TPA: TraB/GumN family protein [Woeseiaceae bacterium]|nr:TraB/GumN family protein [Woeseiaceae bacterium]